MKTNMGHAIVMNNESALIMARCSITSISDLLLIMCWVGWLAGWLAFRMSILVGSFDTLFFV